MEPHSPSWEGHVVEQVEDEVAHSLSWVELQVVTHSFWVVQVDWQVEGHSLLREEREAGRSFQMNHHLDLLRI